MNKIKQIKLDKTNYLEVTWLNEKNEQIHCESFSGHKEHIDLLRVKAKEFNTSLDKFEDIIKQCQDAFIYPSNEQIQSEKRKQFEIQFRFDRDHLLNKTDIAINKAEDLGEDTKALRLYRQALRDATINWVMPESVL